MMTSQEWVKFETRFSHHTKDEIRPTSLFIVESHAACTLASHSDTIDEQNDWTCDLCEAEESECSWSMPDL